MQVAAIAASVTEVCPNAAICEYSEKPQVQVLVCIPGAEQDGSVVVSQAEKLCVCPASVPPPLLPFWLLLFELQAVRQPARIIKTDNMIIGNNRLFIFIFIPRTVYFLTIIANYSIIRGFCKGVTGANLSLFEKVYMLFGSSLSRRNILAVLYLSKERQKIKSILPLLRE